MSLIAQPHVDCAVESYAAISQAAIVSRKRRGLFVIRGHRIRRFRGSRRDDRLRLGLRHKTGMRCRLRLKLTLSLFELFDPLRQQLVLFTKLLGPGSECPTIPQRALPFATLTILAANITAAFTNVSSPKSVRPKRRAKRQITEPWIKTPFFFHAGEIETGTALFPRATDSPYFSLALMCVHDSGWRLLGNQNGTGRSLPTMRIRLLIPIHAQRSVS